MENLQIIDLANYAGPRLKFGKANAKLEEIARTLGKTLVTFSTLAGKDCPYARICKSTVVETPVGLRIVDGDQTEVRCFAASMEVRHPSVYRAHKHNSDLMRSFGGDAEGLARLILASIPKGADIIRVDVAGDFLRQSWFDAWCVVAMLRPELLIYAYTKSLPFVVRRLGRIPSNFVITASRGGCKDHLIEEHALREAIIVYSEVEAEAMGLEIDHDDSHAMDPEGGSFALLLHGAQPKGSKAAKAMAELRKQGKHGYSKGAQQ